MAKPNTDVPREGIYAARVEEAETATSKTSGNRMIALRVKLKGRPGLIRAWITFSPKSRWAVSRFLDSCQLQLPTGADAQDALRPEFVEGRVGFVRLTHTAWQNRLQSQLEFIPREEAFAEEPSLRDVRLPDQTMKTIPGELTETPFAARELPTSLRRSA